MEGLLRRREIQLPQIGYGQFDETDHQQWGNRRL